MRMARIGTAAAGIAASALLLAACSGTPDDESSEGSSNGSTEPVKLTLWQNSTTGDGMQYWEDLAQSFYDETGIEVDVVSIQNEDMDGKLQTALNSGDAPDVFMARGGGKLADVVDAGQVMNLDGLLSQDTIDAMGAGLSAFEIDGSVYGVPTAILPEGFFYSKDLFADAGISAIPTTLDELSDAVTLLQDSGVDAIAVGAQDAWPAAHWYYNFALRECSQDVMNEAALTRTFDDDCWLRAGEDLEAFAATEPFNQGFLTTSAQQGAGSSAGLLANHQAGMELMGAWNPGVIASLTPDEQPLPDLGWFAFPNIDTGSNEGEDGAIMSGADGYSCYVDAPAECVQFLDYMATQKAQEDYAAAFQTIPANKDAQATSVTDEALVELLDAYNSAPYVMLWLDTMYGSTVGNALNVAVVNLLAGSGTPEDIVSAVNDAAAQG